MKLRALTGADLELVEVAKELIRKRRSRISGVAATLKTSKGKIFSGIDVDIEASAPCSICAEYAAIGTMVSEGEREIHTIVAVSAHGKTRYSVLPPCGKCRQFISEFGNPYVIVEVDGTARKARLSELNPLPVVSDE